MSNNTFATKSACSDRQTKKRKRSELKDEPFVKIGSNNAKASVVHLADVGVVIGESSASGILGRAGVGVISRSSRLLSSPSRWTKRRVQTERISPQKDLSLNLQPILKCK
ncbi:hypothetical protein Tco_1474855 [Tanacetum coccineum]